MDRPSNLDELLHQATAAAPRPLAPANGVEPVSDDELPSGTRLNGGRFVIVGVLGRGGFGVTYEAFDERLQRPVAVKELFPDPAQRRGRTVVPSPHAADAFADAKARFLREATVLARFAHPGIVRIYEVLEENDTAYLVMERLDGRTLGELQAERGGSPFAEGEALDLIARCGSALAVVHEDGVLHRDLNPSNVVVTSAGRAVIIDFGLAREFATDTTGSMTRLVTPGYAPLEQYLGEARFGPPTDVYGLAATLYKLLTGRAPVSALDRQGGAPLPSPRRLNPAVSRTVSDGIMDGLELGAEHRPRTMAEFLSRLGVGDRSGVTGAVRLDGVSAAALMRTRRPLPPPSAAAGPPLPPLPAPPPPFSPPVVGTTVGRPVTPSYAAGPRAMSAPPPGPPAMASAPPAPPKTVAGRWKLLVPATAALASLGGTAPVVINGLLIALALPAVATAGDVIVLARLRRRVPPQRLRERVPVPIYAAGRFLRNLTSMLWTGIPAVLASGVLVAGVLLLNATNASPSLRDWVIRVGGASIALLLARPVFGNRARYRAAVVEDVARDRLVEREGRLTHAGWATVIGAIAVATAGLVLRPELWPFPG
ncbi:MAG: serine/threonine-protein kinase [Acidimicrobiales bacterium]